MADLQAPAYCAICNAPILTGPTCDGCDQWPDDEDDVDDEDVDDEQLGPMDYVESYINGNISYVIDELIEIADDDRERALALTASIEGELRKHNQTMTGPLWRRVR